MVLSRTPGLLGSVILTQAHRLMISTQQPKLKKSSNNVFKHPRALRIARRFARLSRTSPFLPNTKEKRSEHALGSPLMSTSQTLCFCKPLKA